MGDPVERIRLFVEDQQQQTALPSLRRPGHTACRGAAAVEKVADVMRQLCCKSSSRAT